MSETDFEWEEQHPNRTDDEDETVNLTNAVERIDSKQHWDFKGPLTVK